MRKITLTQAIQEATMEEMRNDENVLLMGEDVGKLGGCWMTFFGAHKEFGEDRVIDMPIAEASIGYFANGTALLGKKPIVDMMFADFASVAHNAIANEAPKYRFVSGGKNTCPVTYILPNGGNIFSGCHHSQSVETWFTNSPGLKVVMPTTPYDVKGLLKTSIRDDDPVVFLFYKGDLGKRGEVPVEEYNIPFTDAALVRREGTDVTIVALQHMNFIALEAAEELEKEGISVEIVDPRVLIPFDKETIFKSVRKTGKVVITHEAHTRGGFGGEIAALIADECFDSLDAPIKRVGSKNIPIPFGMSERYVYPNKEDIITAVKGLVKK